MSVHEIGHALGMWHEHQREDRDRYIKVVNENLGSWARTNFKPRPKGSTHDYGVPYDYNSVMHYGGTVRCYAYYLATDTYRSVIGYWNFWTLTRIYIISWCHYDNKSRLIFKLW